MISLDLLPSVKLRRYIHIRTGIIATAFLDVLDFSKSLSFVVG